MNLLFLLYAALAVFIVGNLVRILRIVAMPVHLRWELYPVPHGPRNRVRYGGSYLEESDWWTRPRHNNLGGELKIIFPELFLLKGVWQHNRQLWLWSWLLHIALYLLICEMSLAVLVSIVERAGSASAAWRDSAGPAVRVLAVNLSWVAVVSGVVGTVGLIVYRTISLKMRAFTSRAAFLNLTVILSLFITGLLGLITNPAMTDTMISLTGSLLTLNGAPSLRGPTAAHVFIISIFLSYFPFTHMTHMYMKYFTYHKIRWDDAPYREGGRMSGSIARCMNYPVSWSGPHIQGDGKKSWVDIAAEEVSSGAKKTQA